jgi:hypothetical protein
MANYAAMPLMYGNTPVQYPQSQPSFMDRAKGFWNNPDLAMALLANSGYSPQKRTFGEILGTSMLQANQMKQGRTDDEFKREYMKAQMKAMGQPVAVMGPDGKPQYVREQDSYGKQPYQASTNGGIGNIQPGDYTPESLAKYLKSGNVADLQRYESPRQQYSPSYQNVTRTMPDGSTQQGTFDTRSGTYNWTGGVVPAGTKARVEAEGKTIGEATGGQATKKPAQASMDYVLSQFEPILDQTMQGMFAGPLGKAFDYGDRKRFDNLREQLSTELRTVFRIPGEGTLSDREQAQYGLQLPDTSNPPDVNRAILRDVRERVKLRLETPISDAQSPRGGNDTPTFATEAEAEAAGIKPGTRVVIGGVPGTWQ